MKNKISSFCIFTLLAIIIFILWYYFNLMDLLTAVACILIGGVFCIYSFFLIKINKFIPDKEKCTNVDILSKTFSQLTNLQECYTETINKDSQKTSVRAEEIFSSSNIARAMNVNLKTVRSAPGVLSGLGVLGTFIGLTFGISNFENDDTSAVLKSIDNLMNGMNTAFYTSIAGMLLSIIYIMCEKKVLNDLYHATALWCKYLDKTNYMSEIDILREATHNQQEMIIEKLNGIHSASTFYQNELESIKEKLEELCASTKEHALINKEGFNELKQQQTEHCEALKEVFIGYDEEGEEVLPGPMLVHLYEESTKQSQALESFTTDLSNELNSSLGKTMDTSIVPLMHDLKKTHQLFNEKLDLLASNIQTPATDMITTVVSELKSSMTDVTQEFKNSLSNDTVNQMNVLAANLSQTSNVLNSIPSTMQSISDNITLSFGNVRDIINQLQASVQSQHKLLLASTQNANEEMNANMKMQFNEMVNLLATNVNTINNGVTNNLDQAKNIIGDIQNDIKSQQELLIQQTYHTNEAMLNGMKKQFEEMMMLMSSTVTAINSQQNELVEGQGRSTKEIERLLLSFNESIQKMKVSNQEITRTLVSLQEIGENMDQSAEKLKVMSNQMTTINNDLQAQHLENMKQFHKVQEGNQDTLETITEALDNSRSILEKYTEQYDVINEGLENIFKQIDDGLRGYSSTLKESTKDALAEYSNALTESTRGLRNIAESLNDTAEELCDSIDKIKIKFK